jgi:histidyl-tRNA synthetase
LVGERGITEKQADELLDILNIEGTNESLLAQLREKIGDSDGLKEVEATLSLVGGNNVKFSPTLARGLGYYTGNVFEVFLKNKKLLGSALAGGGRYDNMIGSYAGIKKVVPAVGASCGLDVILDALEKIGATVGKQTVADVFVSIIGSASPADAARNYKKGLEICRTLRQAGLKTAIDLENRKLKKNIEYAAKQGIRWMVIAGETELKNGEVILRNLDKGEQETLPINRLVACIV